MNDPLMRIRDKCMKSRLYPQINKVRLDYPRKLSIHCFCFLSITKMRQKLLLVLITTILIIITVSSWLIHAIPIPNGQVGSAEVKCGQQQQGEMEVVFQTEDLFQGRVFVVGHANDSNCVSRDVGKRSTSIVVRQEDRCGMVSARSIDPPGLFVSVRLMISFHEEFITKVDRAYEISCFYMEAEKTVNYTVNPLTIEPNPSSIELEEMSR